MYYVGICDDNSLAREKLGKMVKDYYCEKNETVEIYYFSSGEEVVDYCKNNQDKKEILDILFLDIEMAGMNGVECKNIIEHEANVWRICFTTSHTGFVFDAFSTKTIGYLIKPLENTKVIHILDIVYREKSIRRTISYIDNDGIKRTLFLDKIAYIQAEGSYVMIKLCDSNEDKFIVSRKLGQVEKDLHGTSFVRCHKSYLVNMASVKSIGQQISLSISEEIPIGRVYRNIFANNYKNYVKEMILSRNK